MDGRHRKEIQPGMAVAIVLKKDQRTGRRTEGIVRDLLTKAPYHSRGIKVRLEDGQVGRVQASAEAGPETAEPAGEPGTENR
ncbi:MAG: hypothetical protein C0617_00400 [Desulfuromonas sp.]|uniref:YwbE family protein n=1 Tax=Desulfuromonas sp. TaxID=892 RepID=UPI000CB77AE2|nr:YwbE family protein [Desulfuromonas sp.]PLX86703.1 MAG: hypothetical protein C0617_00400 [Desulfuromonas sp.]